MYVFISCEQIARSRIAKSYSKVMLPFYKNCQIVFKSRCTITFSQNCTSAPVVSIDCSHSSEYAVVSYYDQNFICPVTNDVGLLTMNIFGHSYVFIAKCSNLLPIKKNLIDLTGLFVLLFSCNSSLYIIDTTPLSTTYLQTYSPRFYLVFSLMVSLKEQRLFI